tara:strand:- start:732 stop:1217 length:486 start_codon:yes stop_codon:yes gene_type:complete
MAAECTVKYTDKREQPMLRGYRDADLPMILDSWLRSGLQYPIFTSEVGRPPIRLRVPGTLLLSQSRTLLKTLIPKTHVLVLCNPEDEDHIMGWVCYETEAPCLHFLFIKFNFRRMGMGSRLLSETGLPESPEECEVSWRTPALNFFTKNYKWIWNPFRSWT